MGSLILMILVKKSQLLDSGSQARDTERLIGHLLSIELFVHSGSEVRSWGSGLCRSRGQGGGGGVRAGDERMSSEAAEVCYQWVCFVHARDDAPYTTSPQYCTQTTLH